VAWESLTLPRKRAVAQVLIESITILPTRKGRRAFDPDSVAVTWHGQGASSAAS